jgi:hypothetical protein
MKNVFLTKMRVAIVSRPLMGHKLSIYASGSNR